MAALAPDLDWEGLRGIFVETSMFLKEGLFTICLFCCFMDRVGGRLVGDLQGQEAWVLVTILSVTGLMTSIKLPKHL